MFLLSHSSQGASEVFPYLGTYLVSAILGLSLSKLIPGLLPSFLSSVASQTVIYSMCFLPSFLPSAFHSSPNNIIYLLPPSSTCSWNSIIFFPFSQPCTRFLLRFPHSLFFLYDALQNLFSFFPSFSWHVLGTFIGRHFFFSIHIVSRLPSFLPLPFFPILFLLLSSFLPPWPPVMQPL